MVTLDKFVIFVYDKDSPFRLNLQEGTGMCVGYLFVRFTENDEDGI